MERQLVATCEQLSSGDNTAGDADLRIHTASSEVHVRKKHSSSQPHELHHPILFPTRSNRYRSRIFKLRPAASRRIVMFICIYDFDVGSSSFSPSTPLPYTVEPVQVVRFQVKACQSQHIKNKSYV